MKTYSIEVNERELALLLTIRRMRFGSFTEIHVKDGTPIVWMVATQRVNLDKQEEVDQIIKEGRTARDGGLAVPVMEDARAPVAFEEIDAANVKIAELTAEIEALKAEVIDSAEPGPSLVQSSKKKA